MAAHTNDANGTNGVNGVNDVNGTNHAVNGVTSKLNGTHISDNEGLDALIVGAGFGGVWQLKRLRDEGFNVKLVEAGSNYGGVWYWNRYPGARVDSAIPHYEFSDPILWKDWSWKQRFPGSEELRAYFLHVADNWDLRKDTIFNTNVKSATWNEQESRWLVKTKDDRTYNVKFLLLNTGFAAKRYTPDWPGIDSFKGTWLHPSYWPHEGIDLKNKRVAVIGTGSTGVQLATDLATVAGHLSVFQRTPNMALPMRQVDYTEGEQEIPRPEYPSLFEHRKDSFSGFSFNFAPKSTWEDSPEQRKAFYQTLWDKGDFQFWLATYYDMLFTEEANKEAYNFWRDKTRARINDPKLQEIMAPMKQPHAFGCKRISLENKFFEIFNEPHVSLVDMKSTPIEQVTEKGIKTSDGVEHEFDVVICATGFDAITGGLTSIDINGTTEQSLKQKWEHGTATHLGMSTAGFPNMFFTYGPQAPTALCNGPTCAELQGDWVVNVMKHMKAGGLQKIEAERETEKAWAESIWKLANASLLPNTKSVSTHEFVGICSDANF